VRIEERTDIERKTKLNRNVGVSHFFKNTEKGLFCDEEKL